MTPTEFKSARRRLGLSGAEMARVLNMKDARRIRSYETSPDHMSHRPVPPAAAAMLDLLLWLPIKVRHAYLGARLSQQSRE